MIKPLGNKIQLDIKEVKIGAIQSDAIEEHGTIVAVGPELNNSMTSSNPAEAEVKFPIGATLYFKAWAVDVISKEGVKYYFISSDSDAICAIEYGV